MNPHIVLMWRQGPPGAALARSWERRYWPPRPQSPPRMWLRSGLDRARRRRASRAHRSRAGRAAGDAAGPVTLDADERRLWRQVGPQQPSNRTRSGAVGSGRPRAFRTSPPLCTRHRGTDCSAYIHVDLSKIALFSAISIWWNMTGTVLLSGTVPAYGQIGGGDRDPAVRFVI